MADRGKGREMEICSSTQVSKVDKNTQKDRITFYCPGLYLLDRKQTRVGKEYIPLTAGQGKDNYEVLGSCFVLLSKSYN